MPGDTEFEIGKVGLRAGFFSCENVFDSKISGLHFFLGDGFFAWGIDRNLIRVKKWALHEFLWDSYLKLSHIFN